MNRIEVIEGVLRSIDEKENQSDRMLFELIYQMNLLEARSLSKIDQVERNVTILAINKCEEVENAIIDEVRTLRNKLTITAKKIRSNQLEKKQFDLLERSIRFLIEEQNNEIENISKRIDNHYNNQIDKFKDISIVLESYRNEVIEYMKGIRTQLNEARGKNIESDKIQDQIIRIEEN
jgi:hypothetical protein